MMISHTSTLFLLSFIFTTFISLSSSSKFSTQYSILGPNLDKRPSQDEAIQLFQHWKKQHGRVYTDLQEMAKRFEIFISNMNYIIESNSKKKSYRLGLNNFADLSRKEFKETYLGKIDRPRNSSMKLKDDLPCNAPEYLDWRKKGAVTDVKKQGTCGSCWAFSAVGSIEGINAIANGRLDSLSVQQLLNCAKNEGCKGGTVNTAMEWVINNGGIATEAAIPYEYEENNCTKAEKIPNSVTIDGYEHLAVSDNALLCGVAIQPVSACLNADNDFDFYEAGIYDGDNCSSEFEDINHCVVIVGYDSKGDNNYWIVKNSQGDWWGMDGYMWIKREPDSPYGVCGIHHEGFIPIINEGVSASLKPGISSM